MNAPTSLLAILPLLFHVALLGLSAFPFAGAQEVPASYACIDPSNPAMTTHVYRGEDTTICLYAGPGGNWNSGGVEYTRFAVNLKADEFSSYKIPKSFAYIVDQNPFGSNATHVFASSQSSVSFLRRYYDTTTQQIYPYLTAIIDVEDGVIRGIAWDDACIFCEQSKCSPNTYNFDGAQTTKEEISQPTDGCSRTVAECRALHAGGYDECDLKLFVVWTGTAVGGKVLYSSDSRFSAFPPNRIQENVEKGVNDAVENLKSGVGNAVDTVMDNIPFMGNNDEGEN